MEPSVGAIELANKKLYKRSGKMKVKDFVLSYFDENFSQLNKLAKDIWEYAELGLEEYKSAKAIIDVLCKEGFNIEENISGMSTAFIATWGEGQPVIGILGEYDALAGLSQKVSYIKEARVEGAGGHGCGHNLLGVGSLGAVIAAKRAMEKYHIKGTIKFYGCPAEETISSKVFMARDGVFDDLSASLTWHPDFANAAYYSSTLAMNSFKVNFHGITAHAAGDPQEGRSALDAAIIMDIGVNYLREHVIQEARIHSIITHGGDAPNIVPGYSQIHYIIRAPKRQDVEEIYERVKDIAKGAALITGTKYDIEFICGTYNYMVNHTINDLIAEKLAEIGPMEFSEEEMEFSQKLIDSLEAGQFDSFISTHRLDLDEIGGIICARIADELELKGFSKDEVVPVSGDRADVSYITPSAQFGTTCVPLGIAEHSWQFVASCGSTIGFKGMILAAKVMALATLDFFLKPELLKAAKEELDAMKKGKEYVSPLPDEVRIENIIKKD